MPTSPAEPVAAEMPPSPAELVAKERDPRVRFRLITVLADEQKWLDTAWSKQRIDDLRVLLLSSDPPLRQCDIAAENPISKQRLSNLAKRALGGSA